MKEIAHSYAIGIDIGNSSLRCGLVNNIGEVLYSFSFPLGNVLTDGEVVVFINAAIRKCKERSPKKVLGVGIGFPGTISDNVVIDVTSHFKGFQNVNLGEIIASSTCLRILIDNNINMMIWGEVSKGSGQSYSNTVFLTVDLEIGSGLILDGKLYGGYQNKGVELGHIIIQHGGTRCRCGATGCFEAYASVRALINNYARLKGVNVLDVTEKMIVEGYRIGEPQALNVMDKHFDYMSAGVASIINAFSPQNIVIGGRFTESIDFYIEEIRNRIMRIAMPQAIEYTRIVPTKLGSQTGLLGCAARVFSKFGYE